MVEIVARKRAAHRFGFPLPGAEALSTAGPRHIVSRMMSTVQGRGASAILNANCRASRVHWAAGVVALVGACGGTGAGAPDASSCFAQPMTCNADETCWPTGGSSGDWHCLPALVDAGLHSNCAQEPSPTCAPALLCLGWPLIGSPRCEPRCSTDASTSACAADEVCFTTATTDGRQVSVCLPILGQDGGT